MTTELLPVAYLCIDGRPTKAAQAGLAGIAADRYADAVMAAIARTAAQMSSVILSPGSAWLSSASGLLALVGPGSSVPLFQGVVGCAAFRDYPVFRPTEIVTIVVRAPSR